MEGLRGGGGGGRGEGRGAPTLGGEGLGLLALVATVVFCGRVVLVAAAAVCNELPPPLPAAATAAGAVVVALVVVTEVCVEFLSPGRQQVRQAPGDATASIFGGGGGGGGGWGRVAGGDGGGRRMVVAGMGGWIWRTGRSWMRLLYSMLRGPRRRRGVSAWSRAEEEAHPFQNMRSHYKNISSIWQTAAGHVVKYPACSGKHKQQAHFALASGHWVFFVHSGWHTGWVLGYYTLRKAISFCRQNWCNTCQASHSR